MKMTTEEAFVKVLQMHGIEHAFGIIGSAFMPISDIFPKAGITFWDCAHEGSGGMMADGYTRATGKMSMMIAQNGPGITNFVTAVKTAYWNHTPLLLVTPQAANKTIGQGGFPGSRTDGRLQGHGLLSGRSARSLPHGRSSEPRDLSACVVTPPRRRSISRATTLRRSSTSTCPPSWNSRSHAFGGHTGAGRRSGRTCLSNAKFPVILNGAGVVHRWRDSRLDGAGRTTGRACLLRLPAQRCLSRLAPAAFAGRLGYNGSKAAMELDQPRRMLSCAWHTAESVFDPAGLRHQNTGPRTRKSFRSTSTQTGLA